MPPELKLKLKNVLAGRTSVDMGQFQFVNLERVREEAGPQWEKLRDKVYDVGQHFIEKRLTAADVVIRVRGGFLIIFQSMDAEAAEVVVGQIAAELNRFFLGERFLKELRVLGRSRSVTTAEMLEIVAKSQTGDMPVWKETPQEERLDRDDPHWEAAPPREKLSARTAPVLPEAEYKEDAGVWDDIVFIPAWDARQQSLVHNMCVPRRVVKGVAYYDRDTLMGADDRKQHRALDRSVALAAQRGFQRLYAQGTPCSIVVPVHYDTVASVSQRMGYFAVLQNIPEAMRQYFYLRVDDIPRGAPLGQMQEVFRSMKHFGAYVMAHLPEPMGQRDLQNFEGCGIGSFGADLPADMRADEPSAAALERCNIWVHAAQRLGAETYLTGLESLDSLQAAMATGVRYFSGPLISRETPLPAPSRPLSVADIAAGRTQADDDHDHDHDRDVVEI